MRTIAIVLIIAGLVMIVFKGFNVRTEKKVVDIGPVEVNKKENKWIGWPTYAGGVFCVVGALMLLSSRKKAA